MHDLQPRLQSAYRPHHTTVKSDIYTTFDCWEVTQLGLIDPRAALDCVAHDILLCHLEQSWCIWGLAEISGRKQQVCYASWISVIIQLFFSVPQDLVLGPLLFLLYTTTKLMPLHGLGGRFTPSLVTSRSTSACQKHPCQCPSSCSSKAWACQCMDDQQLAENQRQQNTDDLDRQETTAWRAHEQQVVRPHCWSSEHGQSCFFQLWQLRLVQSSLTGN